MVLDVVIMAAGKGTRMRSARPKVLHRLAGKSLLQHVLDATAGLGADRIVAVTGHAAEQVEAAFADARLSFVRQSPQLGTGHAVQQAAPLLHDDGTTLILSGDVPLIEAATLRALIDASAGARLALLSVVLDDPAGYGRIVRDLAPPTSGSTSTADAGATDDEATLDAPDAVAAGAVRGIVEHKDASAAERELREVYSGVMAAPTAALKHWLGALDNDNAAGEFYLTDVVAMAVREGVPVVAIAASGPTEVMGINDPAQLAALERRFQAAQASRLMRAGVRLADPARFDLRGELRCGADVEIDVNCVFEGHVALGDGVGVGANCVLRNVDIAAGARIQPFTHIDGDELGVRVGAGATVGPFARLRAGTDLGAGVHIGNFVEVKNSTLGAGAKANHLAYLGDATVGQRVNFGAGSITANYDGAAKHRTTIGDDAHIGSNCVLVAPLLIGAGATIGGGSTVSKEAPAGKLTVARARQATLSGWHRPVKPT